MRRRLFVLVVPALAALGGDALAEEPASAATSTVQLEVNPSASGPWALKITNTGESPVRLAADPRLLSFELVPPGGPTDAAPSGKKGAATGPIRCSLPDDARPSSDDGHELVVPAKRSWSVKFDPFFYCFGARERAALVKDAQLKARFGWRPSPSKARAPQSPSPPFAVTPVGASVGKMEPVKELEAAPVTLAESLALGSTPAPPPPAASQPPPSQSASRPEGPPPSSAPAPSVYLTVPETMDAGRGENLSTTVSLVNETDRPITLLFRPDMVTFQVSGPGGGVACGAPKTVGSPIKELFVTVGVKAKTSLGVLFTATCAAGTFDQPGLYRVTPRLDTTNASGRSINVRSWDGVADAKAPLLLRVRQPKRPTMTGPRPALD